MASNKRYITFEQFSHINGGDVETNDAIWNRLHKNLDRQSNQGKIFYSPERLRRVFDDVVSERQAGEVIDQLYATLLRYAAFEKALNDLGALQDSRRSRALTKTTWMLRDHMTSIAGLVCADADAWSDGLQQRLASILRANRVGV